MSCIYPHQMFQADFLGMFREVQRQEEIFPFHSDDAEIGKAIFFFFCEDVLPAIRSNDWVYEATKLFAVKYADEYFTSLRLLGSVKENQERRVKVREEVQDFIIELMANGMAPSSVNLTKASDFITVISYEKLDSYMKQKAKKLHDKAVDLEYLAVHVVAQAVQSLYEKGLPRIFYVVKRALKVKMNLKHTSADNNLLEAHQYLDWCSYNLALQHIISKSLVEHRIFYKVVRNVTSHVAGPKWLPDTDEVYLPDREVQLTVNVTEYIKRYRYLYYFCEIGVRGILGIFCDIEKGAISNRVKDRYIKMYNLKNSSLDCVII